MKTKMKHYNRLNGKKIIPTGFIVAIFFLVIFQFSSVLSFSRSTSLLTGIVKDHKKKPLPGVQVSIKHSPVTTITDIDGLFSLPLIIENMNEHQKSNTLTLIFHRKGYYPIERIVRPDSKSKSFRLFFISRQYALHTVAVTALSREEKRDRVPMAENVIPQSEILEKVPGNLVESIADTPGVHFIGKGGRDVTPSIRGLARRRVLLLVDGARITSDRRVGASASFLPPGFIRNIDVVRSSSSVLYGSDALGGVVNITTRPANLTSSDSHTSPGNKIDLDLNSSGKRINTGFNYGYQWKNTGLYSGFRYSNAENYRSPDTTIYHSSYSNFSGILDFSYKGKNRDFFLGCISAMGKDMGKPDRNNDPDKYSIVPFQSNTIIRMGYKEKNWLKNGNLHFSFFLDPTRYNLEKIDNPKQRTERSETTSINMGLKSYIEKNLSDTFSYLAGLEWYSRQNLGIKNIVTTPIGKEITDPVSSGERNDYSLFLTMNYSGIPSLHLNGGVRYTFFSIKADMSGSPIKKDTGDSSYFLGAAYKVGPSVSIFGNISRAFRFPSLSESFYTGITGRKYVRGNPQLKPESSFNIDTGVKVFNRNGFLGVYLFSYTVDDLIERYKSNETINGDAIYTYDNIHRGRITGLEIEGRYSFWDRLEVFGHFFKYRGRSNIGDEPLNDVPAPRVFLGGKILFSRGWGGAELLCSFKKNDPGPAEAFNNAYQVLNVNGGWYLSSACVVHLKVSNLLNATYYANADTDIPPARGIDFSAGIHFYLP